MLFRFALPRLLYQLELSKVNKRLLKELDSLIRKAVKNWCHLPACMTDGLLYLCHHYGMSSNYEAGVSHSNIKDQNVFETYLFFRQNNIMLGKRKCLLGTIKGIATKTGLLIPKSDQSSRTFHYNWRDMERKTEKDLLFKGIV